MEHKYESDMTIKEKRQREFKKLKSMTFMEKIDYIWTYYKSVFVMLLIVLGIGYVGVTMYNGMQENLVLSVAIIGGDVLTEGEIKSAEKEIKEWLKADGKHDTVRIQTNISGDENDMSSTMMLTTLIAAKAIDVVICPQGTFDEFYTQGGLVPNSHRYTKEKFLSEKFGIMYDESYIAVMANSKNQEAGQKFLEYVKTNASQEPEVLE